MTGIVSGAVKAGVDWSTVNICTYRNNLNKVGPPNGSYQATIVP